MVRKLLVLCFTVVIGAPVYATIQPIAPEKICNIILEGLILHLKANLDSAIYYSQLETSGWNVEYVNYRQIAIVRHPLEPSLFFVIPAFFAGDETAEINAEDKQNLVRELSAGRPYVMSVARQAYATMDQISLTEAAKIRTRPDLTSQLTFMGWTRTVLRQGLVFEQGEGDIDVDWVVKFTSQDGKKSLTEAFDMRATSIDYIQSLVGLVNAGGHHITDRAREALASQDEWVPGSNERYKGRVP